VIEANAHDGGTRRCVLVQAAEPTAADSEAARHGLDSIAAIARARVRATIERLEATPGSPPVGVRAFELVAGAPDPSWDGDREQLLQVLRGDP
jgi:hypothetical protein